MYTKSIIQQISESIQTKDNFKTSLESIMDKYVIEDSVFAYKNETYEVVDGYFVVENEYDNLKNAVSECDITSMGIRIINNEIFQIGKLNRFISECDKNKKVFDLRHLENVR